MPPLPGVINEVFLHHILTYLIPKELCKCAFVSRSWYVSPYYTRILIFYARYVFSGDNELWKPLAKQDYPHEDIVNDSRFHTKAPQFSWKERYRTFVVSRQMCEEMSIKDLDLFPRNELSGKQWFTDKKAFLQLFRRR